MFKNSGKSHLRPLMWGAPGSAFSGKTRSYLIKKGIDYQEIFPSHRRFKEEIMPTIGYFVMPVMELEDGLLIQDSTDIILYFEEKYPERPMIPKTPVLQALAWLVGYFGSESFLIPGMHYRWSFLDEQRSSVEAMFGRIFSAERNMDKQREEIAPVMDFFNGFLPDLGITKETIPMIEQSHEAFLVLLNDHFLHFPYLLGGRPSLADFGMTSILYAHIAQDPHSSVMMKRIAPHVYRWTERMNEAGIVDGEFPDMAPEYPTNDAPPETLFPVLRYLFSDCAPETVAMVKVYNAWIRANADLPASSHIQSDPAAPSGAHPLLGHFEFELRGVTVRRQVFADAIYHLQRVLDVVSGLDGAGREKFDALIESVGGGSLLATTLERRIKNENYRFVLT